MYIILKIYNKTNGENFMPLGFFNDKNLIPSESEIEGVLGQVQALWNNVKLHIEKYGATKEEWKIYTKAAGWCKKILLTDGKNERNMLFMYPNLNYFTCVLVFGEKAVAIAENSDIPESIIESIKQAKPYREGRSFNVEIRTPQDYEVLKKLIDIKMKENNMTNTGIKYLTKKLLVEYNTASKKEKRNQNITQELINALPDDKHYIVADYSYHTYEEIRATIAISGNNDYAFLDMSLYRFNLLPDIYEDDFGIYHYLNDSDIKANFPYKEREWTEKRIRKTSRKQSNFRDIVLKAYNNKCAICGLKETKLLRAAHIVDVADDGTDDIHNGICLCINHEVAFDKGLIKITENGDIETKIKDELITNSKIFYPLNKKDYPLKSNLQRKYNKTHR